MNLLDGLTLWKECIFHQLLLIMASLWMHLFITKIEYLALHWLWLVLSQQRCSTLHSLDPWMGLWGPRWAAQWVAPLTNFSEKNGKGLLHFRAKLKLWGQLEVGPPRVERAVWLCSLQTSRPLNYNFFLVSLVFFID